MTVPSLASHSWGFPREALESSVSRQSSTRSMGLPLRKVEPEARSPSPVSGCGPRWGEGRGAGKSQQEMRLPPSLSLAPRGALSKSATLHGPSVPIPTERGWVGGPRAAVPHPRCALGSSVVLFKSVVPDLSSRDTDNSQYQASVILKSFPLLSEALPLQVWSMDQPQHLEMC